MDTDSADVVVALFDLGRVHCDAQVDVVLDEGIAESHPRTQGRGLGVCEKTASTPSPVCWAT